MMFGVLPFPANNIQTLTTLVKTTSGKNLKFPATNPISNLAKDILRRLLEPNPKDRITWREFFTHPIFFDTKNSTFGISALVNPLSMNKSYINPQVANAVNSRFQHDTQKAQNSTKFALADPL